MSYSLLQLIYKNSADLLPKVEAFLDEGHNPNQITKYCESPLRVASNNGRFDVIELLLSRGADESQLGWTSLFHAIAYQSSDTLRELIVTGSDLEHKDFWERTPFLFSILVGDITKTEILVQAGADIGAVGRCAKTAMAYAIQKDNVDMLNWLIENGFDPEQTDRFGTTPLIDAAEGGAKKSVDALINHGVDIYRENNIPEQAITVTNSLDIVRALVSAGADINDINKETRAKMLGYAVDMAPDVSKQEYFNDKYRVFGKSNPEVANKPFWQAMVKCGGSAYHAASKFDKKRSIFDDDPVWSFDRFGKSITPLSDGRFIEIAGEHEDSYDPDFCIYNDVFVHKGNGECDIYIYPKEVFPPTDFHTATLVGHRIYIIGTLGYLEDRRPGHTPVYQLDIKTLKIEEVKTGGEMPGWISRHKAYFDGHSTITVKGGKLIVTKDGKEEYVDNTSEFELSLTTMKWKNLSKNMSDY